MPKSVFVLSKCHNDAWCFSMFVFILFLNWVSWSPGHKTHKDNIKSRWKTAVSDKLMGEIENYSEEQH